ncbi:MAG: hypothetical protein EOP61_29215, partial [Sphingomonadales bacterium]
TGKVKLIYRDFPIDGQGMGLLFASVARCAGKDNYVAMVDEFFTRQYDLLNAAQTGSALPVLNEIGAKFGLSQDQILTCIDHRPDLKQSILDAQKAASDKGVRSTPTIYINDEVVSNPTQENVIAAIEKALGNPVPAAATTETPVAPAGAAPAPAAAPGAVPPATPPQ